MYDKFIEEFHKENKYLKYYFRSKRIETVSQNAGSAEMELTLDL